MQHLKERQGKYTKILLRNIQVEKMGFQALLEDFDAPCCSNAMRKLVPAPWCKMRKGSGKVQGALSKIRRDFQQ